jgi:phage-related protein
MALELSRAYVQIVPSMQGVQSEIARSFGVGSPMDKQAAAAGKRSGGLLSKGLGGALLVGAGPLAGIALAGVGVAKLTGYVTDSVKAVANWQALNAQSASAVKATGGAANVSAKQVNALAQSLEGQTSTQAESIQQGANLLLTFRGVRNEAGKGNDVFNQTTAAAVDMARALGTDVPSAAMMLGKALNDPAAGMTRLTRSGVTFTKEQQNQVKALQASGDTIGAQKVILAELNKEFGGSGAAYRKTFSGQLYQLQDAVGDFGEEIATAAMPALTALVGTATKVVAWAGSLNLGAKAASGIGTVVSAIGPPIVAALGQIGPLFSNLGKSAGPGIAGIGAAFAPLIPTIVGLVPQVVTLFTAFNPLGLVLRSLLPVLPQLLPPILSLAGALGGALSQVLAAVVPLVVQLAGTFITVSTTLASALIPVLTIVVSSLLPVVGSVITTLLPVIVQLADTLGPVLTGVIESLLPVVTSIIGTLASLVPVFVPIIAQVLKLAASIIAQLVPALLPLVSAVLPLVATLLKALIPVVLPVVKILGTTLAGVIKALLPVITAVFGAIVPIIRAALTIITGVLNLVVGLLTGNFKQAWHGLGQIVSGAIGLVVGVLKGAVSIVGAALGAIVNGGIAVLKGAVQLVLSIGGDIVAGLVQGIRNGFSLVVGAARALAQLLPDWVRKVLGIHSPSRVFASIGRFVGQGLVKGLAGSQDQVKTAATSLVNQVTDAFTKLADQREAAQKRLTKLDKQLAGTDTSTKSGKASAAKLRDQISEQRGILADIKAAPKGAKRKSLLADLKADTSQLTSLAGRRDKLADQLKTAQGKLADAVKVRDDFRDQVQQTTIGLGDVVASFNKVVDIRSKAADAIDDLTGKLADLGKSQASAQDDVASAQRDLDGNARDIAAAQADAASNAAQMAQYAQYGSDYASKLADLQSKAADYAGKIADLQSTRVDLTGKLSDQMAKVADYATQTATAQSNLATAQADSTKASAPTILATLQQAVTDTNAFQTTLGQLKTQGLDDTTYSQLLQAGVAGGGLQAAQELAAAGPGVVQQVANLQGQLSTAGKALGTQTSTVLYQAGVDTAQASVNGIKSKIVDNQAAIGLLEAAMAQSVKTLGINTSALTKGVGAQIVAGLTDGIKGKGSDLDKVIGDLGKSAVKKLKKVLGIKSPSRVVRQEVGQQVGAGFVLGIEDMHAAAEQAAAGLASVPGAAIGDAGFGDLGTAPAPITQVFTGPMGYTRDEVADGIATKARRALAGVNIPKVSVR